MHELSIATSVFDSVCNVANNNSAKKINKIDLVVGTSSAIIVEALDSAFDALKELNEYSLCKKAKINILLKESKSICLDCGCEYTHGMGAAQCPSCQSFNTQNIEGKDIFIDKIEVE